jgi:periodic tryptophan protein 1
MVEHGEMALATDEQIDEEDAEDDRIRPDDTMICAAVTEEDFSHIEVHVYNAKDGTMFVHHDINLPEFPLCLAWLDCPPFLVDGAQQMVGNYVAVGTFDPAIEIWNLDVLDPLEPTAILGGKTLKTVKTTNKKTGIKSTREKEIFHPGSHEAAVMSLSWNSLYRQAIASGSADNSVKIWDVTNQTCSHTFNHHTDKVCLNTCTCTCTRI